VLEGLLEKAKKKLQQIRQSFTRKRTTTQKSPRQELLERGTKSRQRIIAKGTALSIAKKQRGSQQSSLKSREAAEKELIRKSAQAIRSGSKTLKELYSDLPDPVQEALKATSKEVKRRQLLWVEFYLGYLDRLGVCGQVLKVVRKP
jgi:hypothetical protein